MTANGAYYISGFACTGSMRPALDCGDEGIFLRPPFTTPLVVGDIISFAPPVECRYYKKHAVSKAHRIIAVRVENGNPFYTTQGDTSPTPDSCEVTLDQIDGKLTEVRKGARPQDVIDTSGYDTAKEAVATLQTIHADKKAAYDIQRDSYNVMVEEYEALIAQSQVTQEQISRTFQEIDSQVKSLNQLSQELNLLGQQINETIGQVDALYQQLFIN